MKKFCGLIIIKLANLLRRRFPRLFLIFSESNIVQKLYKGRVKNWAQSRTKSLRRKKRVKRKKLEKTLIREPSQELRDLLMCAVNSCLGE